MFTHSLSSLTLMKHGRSRSITGENPKGEKGSGGKASSHLGPSRKGSPCIQGLEPGSTVTLADINGPGVIQHIWMTVTDRTEHDYYVLRDLVLRMYWDGEKNPSVEVPLGDFFCLGFGRSYEVNSIPIAVNPTRAMNCYFQMPFKENAKITIENQHEVTVPAFFFQIDYCLTDDMPEEVLYFHAQWRRERETTKTIDYTVLDNVKGKGHYVGTFLALTTLERYWWGEGEMKFYLDGDTDFPTICGTGTEDYFGGAWSFGYEEDGEVKEKTFCTPFMGYPFYSKTNDTVYFKYHNNDTLPQRSFYRWHIYDPIIFHEDLRVTLQQIGTCHKGNFERADDVASVAYWYQTEPHNLFPKLPEKEMRWPR